MFQAYSAALAVTLTLLSLSRLDSPLTHEKGNLFPLCSGIILLFLRNKSFINICIHFFDCCIVGSRNSDVIPGLCCFCSARGPTHITLQQGEKIFTRILFILELSGELMCFSSLVSELVGRKHKNQSKRTIFFSAFLLNHYCSPGIDLIILVFRKAKNYLLKTQRIIVSGGRHWKNLPNLTSMFSKLKCLLFITLTLMAEIVPS